MLLDSKIGIVATNDGIENKISIDVDMRKTLSEVLTIMEMAQTDIFRVAQMCNESTQLGAEIILGMTMEEIYNTLNREQ